MTDSHIITDFQTLSDGDSDGWRYFSDRVMGGVSLGSAGVERVKERMALRLRGEVSLANNGGFVQVARDLGNGREVDAHDWDGICLTLAGLGEGVAVNLRTADTLRPWQSYRHSLPVTENWTTHALPFSGFTPHRIADPLNTGRLRRIGLIAIGKAGPIDVSIKEIAFYRE